MYLITARLLAPGAVHIAPDSGQVGEILSIGAGHSGKDALRHVYSRGDDAGISLVLYIHSKNLFQAEASARELLEQAIETSESLSGWTIAHCAADLISQVMDQIIGLL